MLSVDDIPCAMMITDMQGHVQRLNAEFLQIVGGAESRWRGHSMEVLLTPAARIFSQTHLFPMLYHGGSAREVYLHLVGADGQPVPVMVNAVYKSVDGQDQVVWALFVARERSRFEAELIKARAEAEGLAARLAESSKQVERLNHQLSSHAQQVELQNLQLSELSLTDPLTGLRNRRALELAVQKWQARDDGTGKVSLLVVDVDHFKRINDCFGHPEGDRVLIELAQQLLVSARASDLVVRLGGEEFVLWLPDTSQAAAWRVATRLHECVAGLRAPVGAVTVSVGLVAWSGPSGPDLMHHLLSKADEAMYEAKARGRNRTVVAEWPSPTASSVETARRSTS